MMSDSNGQRFTPGQWGEHYVKPEARPFDRWIISTPCGDMILQSPFQVGDAQHAANARLVAAASSLYEACKAALCALNPHYLGQWDPHRDTSAILRKAIAKAEGKDA